MQHCGATLEEIVGGGCVSADTRAAMLMIRTSRSPLGQRLPHSANYFQRSCHTAGVRGVMWGRNFGFELTFSLAYERGDQFWFSRPLLPWCFQARKGAWFRVIR